MGDSSADFDREQWRAQLLALNSWAATDEVTLPQSTDWDADRGHFKGDAFLQARKAACEDRLRQGADAWREWAEGMEALRAELKSAARWRCRYRHDERADGTFISALHSDTEECVHYLALAVADFRRFEFSEGADFSKWLFPGVAEFRTATFGANISFENAVFSAAADFQSARFSGNAVFKGVKITDWAGFEQTSFGEVVSFEKGEIGGNCDFRDVKTKRYFGLRGAQIGGGLVLRDAECADQADLREVICTSKAEFQQAQFERLYLQDAALNDEADFTGAAVSASAMFDRAKFAKKADFTGARFATSACFDHAILHETALFEEAHFMDEATFVETQCLGEAQFKGARFHKPAIFRKFLVRGAAGFEAVRFKEDVNWREAVFSAATSFNDALFEARTEFSHAKFEGAVKFEETEFKKNVTFDHAVFSKYTSFNSAIFASAAIFDDAIFQSETRFEQALFTRLTSFRRAVFEEQARFNGVYGKEGSTLDLTGAEFSEPPNFVQAHFQEAPRFDNVKVNRRTDEGISWWWPFSRRYKERDLVARWRNLKRLAVQGHDRQSELDFYAEEIKARRFVRDFPVPGRWGRDWKKPWSPLWPGGAQYWVGRAYQLFSNFGRSLVWPLLWWGLSLLVFTGVYLNAHFGSDAITGDTAAEAPPQNIVEWAIRGAPELECVAGPSNPIYEAAYLSAVRGLVFTGYAGRERMPQTYACLYGLYGEVPEGQALPDNFTPVLPLLISYVGIFQLLMSVGLLALFLLAVRSHFRIR